VERKQAGRLSATRARRDAGAVTQALAALKQAASTEGENLMPYFLDAARARASEGEMVAALQEVFGSYTEQPVF
jgi:methylmalonyl-CoA mutase N-terminal domain/subunit